jgi:hypothetical protein
MAKKPSKWNIPAGTRDEDVASFITFRGLSGSLAVSGLG